MWVFSPPTPGHHIIRITNQPVFPLRKPTTFPPSQEKSVVLMAGPPGRNDCTTAALTAAASNLPTQFSTNLSKKPPVISNQRRCLVGIQLSKKGNKSKFYVLSITKSSRNLMEAQASQCFQSRESSNPFFPTHGPPHKHRKKSRICFLMESHGSLKRAAIQSDSLWKASYLKKNRRSSQRISRILNKWLTGHLGPGGLDS